MSSLQFMKYKKIKRPGSEKGLKVKELSPRKSWPLILHIAIAFVVLHSILYTFCYGLVVSDIGSETSFNTLSMLKASFAEKESALVLEIKGTQPLDYSTMFLDANQENQYRFCVDINNARNKLDVKNLKVNNDQQSSEPISLTNLIGQSSFPLSNLVVAQNSLTPLITRMVFHLREKVEPTVQVDNETMQVKIPLAYVNSTKDNGQKTTTTSSNVYEPKVSITKEPEPESPSSNSESLKDRAPERPAIIESIKPVFLPKTTKLEISSDRPLRIKEVKMSKGGVLKIEIFNAKTSLPNAINVDKGIIRNIAFETQAYDLRIYMNLTESVLYDVESSQKGLIVTLQNPLLEQLVSINVNNEPISSVLLMLFTQYGANIVAGSDVKGNVTARLLDVPLKAALNEILKAEEYSYVEENGLIRVISKAKLEEMQAKEAAAEKNKKPIVSIQSKLYQLKYAKVNDIQQTIQKVAGTESQVLTDTRTNSLILSATTSQEQFNEIDKKVDEIIKQLDVEIPEEIPVIAEQIKTETAPPIPTEIVRKIFRLNYMDPEKMKLILSPLLSDKGRVEAVELKKKEQESSQSGGGDTGGGMGSGTSTAGQGMKLAEAIGQGGYLVVSDVPEVIEQVQKEIAKIDVPIPQVEIEAFIVEGALSHNKEIGIDWSSISKENSTSLSFTKDKGAIITKGILPVEKFTGILNILANNSDLKVMSNPAITTLEGQTAMFHSGDKIPYSKIFIQDGIEQIDTVFEEVGIVLAATPYVKDNNMVSLVLSTSVSSESGFTPSGQPRISTRNTRSQVLVKSGDTVVIAGLSSEKNSTTVSKVPIIGDIPLIGKIFSSEDQIKQRSEVTIFITPRIIEHNTGGDGK